MIHNPQVNADLQAHGVKFLQDTHGNTLIPFDELKPDDIVLIPAFGTTLEIENKLHHLGIQIEEYNTTCPFVEKVWNRSEAIAKDKYTIIIHGKPKHEETRATFSHASVHSPSVIVKDMEQTKELAKFITGEKPSSSFYEEFKGQYSDDFDVEKDLQRVGVVNQTTMLASDTQAIADYLKNIVSQRYGLTEEKINEKFADTRDTLCYATNDNQTAVSGMLSQDADIAVIVGGRNSSNTSHLVELCEEKLPSFFIRSEDDIISDKTICQYNWRTKQESMVDDWLPLHRPARILVTSGASCPDAMVEGVLKKIHSFYADARDFEAAIKEWD